MKTLACKAITALTSLDSEFNIGDILRDSHGYFPTVTNSQWSHIVHSGLKVKCNKRIISLNLITTLLQHFFPTDKTFRRAQ